MMKSYNTFDDFLKAQSAKNQHLIRALRTLVNKSVPTLVETIKWGNGCWLSVNLPVVYVHCEKDYVQLGFFGGALLDDPKQLLEGSGRYVRHIKFRTTDEIKPRALAPLIRQAAKINYKAKARKSSQ